MCLFLLASYTLQSWMFVLFLELDSLGLKKLDEVGQLARSLWVNLLSRVPSGRIMHHQVISRQVFPCHSIAPAIWLLEYLERNRNVWLTLLIAWQNKLRKGTLKYELGLVRKMINSFLFNHSTTPKRRTAPSWCWAGAARVFSLWLPPVMHLKLPPLQF